MSCHGSNGIKIYIFDKERYIKQTNDIREWQKKSAEFRRLAKKDHVLKESGVRTQGRREVEVGTRLLGNDKNNVITDKVLS